MESSRVAAFVHGISAWCDFRLASCGRQARADPLYRNAGWSHYSHNEHVPHSMAIYQQSAFEAQTITKLVLRFPRFIRLAFEFLFQELNLPQAFGYHHLLIVFKYLISFLLIIVLPFLGFIWIKKGFVKS